MTRCIARLWYFVFVIAASPAYANWVPPAELLPHLDSLQESQREFVDSGRIFEFMSERQFEMELQQRDAEGVSKLVNDLMSFAERMRYDPERDMGAAPLNLDAKYFNPGARRTPPLLRKEERDAGPFSVHRYLFPQSGIPTFAGAKVAVWTEDLIAGAVDVAIVGIPSNMSSGRRDAAFGPNHMRALNTIGAPDGQSLVDPLDVLSVVDYGTFLADSMSAERSVDHIIEMVSETAATGAVPMVVGGDTSILFATVRGVAAQHGDQAFGLLHLGAHSDVSRVDAHTISDRSAIFRLIEERVVAGEDVIQVGLRGPSVDAATLAWMQDRNVRYHTMAEFHRRGAGRVLARVKREIRRGPPAYFLSVDVSVVDPSDLIAAGRVSADGLHISDVARLVRHTCAAKNVVGFEITDLAPMLDLSRLSVLHANTILNACLVGVAVRKAGFSPDYVHPLALDHGQR